MSVLTPAHIALNTVEEGNDEVSWPKTPFDKTTVSVQLEEATFRSKLKKQATSNLIASLHSLKPVDVVDNRLIDVITLNEDSTRTTSRLTVRQLLNEINRVYKNKNILANALQDPTVSLSPAVQSALRKWTHRSRKNSSLPAGESIAELQIRDLRQLDNHFDHQEDPYLLVRRHCVLISLGPQIRVIVQSKRLMILAHQDDDNDKEQIQTLLKLLANVQDLMRSPKLGVEMSEVLIPFEVKAYSAVFSLYHSLLSKEYATHLFNSKSMVTAIGSHTMLSVKLQEFMHTNHDNAVDLQSRLASTTKMIAGLLVNETDLLFMNLKAAEKNHSLYSLSAEDAEVEVCTIFPDMEAVVESILVDFRTIERKTDVMVRKLEHLEESINMKLSTSCNELLFASTIMSVFGTVIGFGGYVTGAFGMNLDNTEKIQTTPGWFAGVCSSTLFLIIFGSLAIIAVFYHFSYLPTHAHMFRNSSLTKATMA